MTLLKIFNFPDQIGTDKIFHLIISFIITVGVTVLGTHIFNEPGDALVLGIATSFIIGIGKECYDKFIIKYIFDTIDFCFDIIGIAMAAFTILCFI